VTEITHSPTWAEFALDWPISSTRGDGFNYNSCNAQLVSAIITKLTGVSALDYAKAKPFAPVGITDVFWLDDPQRISIGEFGSYLQTSDLAKNWIPILAQWYMRGRATTSGCLDRKG
jgi:CubicO group peptidase (beta-lactamase class C family)